MPCPTKRPEFPDNPSAGRSLLGPAVPEPGACVTRECSRRESFEHARDGHTKSWASADDRYLPIQFGREKRHQRRGGDKSAYGVSLSSMRGNGIVSRTWWRPQIQLTVRSM